MGATWNRPSEPQWDAHAYSGRKLPPPTGIFYYFLVPNISFIHLLE
jgi:hypothetical protein